MKSRHRAREVALQVLYRYDVAAQQQVVKALAPQSPQSLLAELQGHFDHFKVPMDARSFAAELVAGTLREMTDLDALIEKHAVNWKVARMGFIDRCLLRMAIYELKHFKDIPSSVTLDEAVELAKQFGTADTPAFVNGVLDSVKQGLPVES